MQLFCVRFQDKDLKQSRFSRLKLLLSWCLLSSSAAISTNRQLGFLFLGLLLQEPIGVLEKSLMCSLSAVLNNLANDGVRDRFWFLLVLWG